MSPLTEIILAGGGEPRPADQLRQLRPFKSVQPHPSPAWRGYSAAGHLAGSAKPARGPGGSDQDSGRRGTPAQHHGTLIHLSNPPNRGHEPPGSRRSPARFGRTGGHQSRPNCSFWRVLTRIRPAARPAKNRAHHAITPCSTWIAPEDWPNRLQPRFLSVVIVHVGIDC